MNIKQFAVIPMMIAVLACILQIVDQTIAAGFFPEGNTGFGWISFQAWAMYFLAGCTLKGGIRSLIGYILGIAASIAIMKLAGVLGGLGFFAAPIAILIVVIPVIFLERAPDLFNFVPAIFVGAGVYFGFMNYVSGESFIAAGVTETAYCLIGLMFGWVTVTLRGAYEKALQKG